MIPIHKKGKSKTEASSYRPISCIVKVLESIINTRLKWFIESEHLLAAELSGFREHHCTGEKNTYITQEIEDESQHKKYTLTVWIDLQKAFDKVWTDGLLLKRKKCNIVGNIFLCIKSFLHNRRARVVVGNTKSKKLLFRHGVPQGGIISPTLFIVVLLLSTLASGGGESDLPACDPPASFSVHPASSAVTPAGSVHKSRGDNVERMWVQLKR